MAVDNRCIIGIEHLLEGGCIEGEVKHCCDFFHKWKVIRSHLIHSIFHPVVVFLNILGIVGTTLDQQLLSLPDGDSLMTERECVIHLIDVSFVGVWRNHPLALSKTEFCSSIRGIQAVELRKHADSCAIIVSSKSLNLSPREVWAKEV